MEIIECSSGASTLVLAQCAKQNGSGHVYSLEHDIEYVEKTNGLIEKAKLSDWATVIHAPLSNYKIHGKTYKWYSKKQLKNIINIDMLVVDGPPFYVSDMARYPALPELYKKFNPDCTVFLDDADREQEKKIVKAWQSEFSHLTIYNFDCEKGCVCLK